MFQPDLVPLSQLKLAIHGKDFTPPRDICRWAGLHLTSSQWQAAIDNGFFDKIETLSLPIEKATPLQSLLRRCACLRQLHLTSAEQVPVVGAWLLSRQTPRLHLHTRHIEFWRWLQRHPLPAPVEVTLQAEEAELLVQETQPLLTNLYALHLRPLRATQGLAERLRPCGEVLQSLEFGDADDPSAGEALLKNPWLALRRLHLQCQHARSAPLSLQASRFPALESLSISSYRDLSLDTALHRLKKISLSCRQPTHTLPKAIDALLPQLQILKLDDILSDQLSMPALSHGRSLQEISLKRTKNNEKTYQAIECLHSLKKLELMSGHHRLGDLWNALSNCHKLSQISLLFTKITTKENKIKSSLNLKTLEVIPNHQSRAEVPGLLIDGCESTLEHLILRDVNLDNLLPLADLFPQISSLTLSNMKLSSTENLHSLNQTLQHFELTLSDSIDPAGVSEELISWLTQQDWPVLETLRLPDVNILDKLAPWLQLHHCPLLNEVVCGFSNSHWTQQPDNLSLAILYAGQQALPGSIAASDEAD